MSDFLNSKVIGLITVLAIGAAGVGIVVYRTTSTPKSSAVVQTPEWYVAHPDELRAANVRCQNEGTTLPAGFCENIAIADKTMSDNNALAALDAASTATPSKNQ